MAKKPYRQRRRLSPETYRKVRFQKQLSLVTLAASTLLSGSVMSSASNKVRIASVEINFLWDDATGFRDANADGPLLVGVAHGDYTDAEIEQCVESLAALDFDDTIQAEHSQRRVRVIGSVSPKHEMLPNSGGLKKVKLNWTIGEGTNLKFWAYNLSQGVALTTGSGLHASGNVNVFRA